MAPHISSHIAPRYGDSVDNTAEQNSSIFSLIPDGAGGHQQGTRTVQLCTNKVLQFFTAGAA